VTLERIIQTVGMATFASHYIDFKNKDKSECYDILKKYGYSRNVIYSKVSKALHIISCKEDKEALILIINSKSGMVKSSTREKARILLASIEN